MDDDEPCGEVLEIIALKHDLYCRCYINGHPVPPKMAMEFHGHPDHAVEFWVPCGKDDMFAVLDLNAAEVIWATSR